MKTISAAVEAYVKSKPFLQTALDQGIINLSSLARIIVPEIKSETGKSVQEGAVVMALKRLSTDMEFRLSHKVVRVVKNITEITVRSQITDYAYKISEDIFHKQAELMNLISRHKGIFYTSSRGVHELNIVISNHLEETVDLIFEKEKCLQKLENLSAISIVLPGENTIVSGIYYFIFQRLSWEGIIINEVISTSNEFTFLVNDKQADTAFRVINNLKSI